MLFRSTLALTCVALFLTAMYCLAAEPKRAPLQPELRPAAVQLQQSDVSELQSTGGPKVRSLPTLSLAEQKIKVVLANDKTTLEFVEIPLKDVVDYIKDKHHLEMTFDVNALKDAAIDPTALPVNVNVHDLTLRSALNLILSQFNLTHLVQDDVLTITTKDKANSIFTLRLYDVRDLMPQGDAAAVAGALNQLKDFVSGATGWISTEGQGPIKSFTSDSLCVIAISQPQAVHEEVSQLLSDLRKLKAQKSTKE